MAIATWIVPAGTYDLDKEGSPIPGTYHEVPSHPARILVDSLTAPINGLYGIEDAEGQHRLLQHAATCSAPSTSRCSSSSSAGSSASR